MRKSRTGFATLAIALVAVLAMGMLTVSTGVAGNFDTDLPFFAQKGNGNGNGNGGNNPPAVPGTGNNGQGQGQENGNPPEENPGQGNSPADSDEGDTDVPVDDDTDTPNDGDSDAPENAESPASRNAPEKVNVCHVTNRETGDTEMITISSRAVPAHENHGDEMIDVASADECPQAEAPEEPGATPTPGDGEDEDAGEDEGATPPADGATPMATPDIS